MGRTQDGAIRVSVVRVGDEELAVVSWPATEGQLPSCLTEAERAIASLLLAGESNQAIALRRGTSTRTVANQIASIFAKLGVQSRSELAFLCASGRSGRP